MRSLLVSLPVLLIACTPADPPAAGERDATTGSPGEDASLPKDSPDGTTAPDARLGDAGEPADLGGPAGDGGRDQGPNDAGHAAPELGLPDGGPDRCEAPTPFVAPSDPTGWRHDTTRLLTVTQGAPNHRAQDVIVATGRPQLIVGKFAYGPFDKDLEDEEVEVFVQERPPCGEWISLGVQLTSRDGQYGDQYGLADDGGRIFFTLPDAQARPVGHHPLRLLVRGDGSLATATLTVLPAGTSTVVFDIDGTLTTRDFELIRELFTELLQGSYVPEMREGAPDVVWDWVARGYLVVYLSGRPDLLHRQPRLWLQEEGFPPGPLHLTDTNAQALPTRAGVGQYKIDFLRKIEEEGLVTLAAAYGNATTDIFAYAGAGIPLATTFIVGEHAGEEGTTPIAGYPEHLPEAAALPAATVAAPPAGDW